MTSSLRTHITRSEQPLWRDLPAASRVHRSLRMLRGAREVLLLLPVMILLVGGQGCQQGSPESAKLVVVFMDVSGSIRDFDVYRDGWRKIVENLKGGDRIVLGRITDATFTRFRPLLDTELPVFNPLTDNKLRFEKRVRAIREDLTEGIEKALAAPRSPKTDVMNSLVLAEKIFAGNQRRPVLVLLSDMLEDSQAYNLERVSISDDFIRRVIDENRRKGQLPDLRGATVYVAGASARNASKAHAVQRFWVEYAKAANARLLPENYGPALLNYQE